MPEHARRHNRSLVIHELLRHGPLARVDLARATQLTAATIGDLVGNLLEEGLVEERGRRPTGTGKPATLLGIVPDARHMVCVDLSDQSRFVGGVVNLLGEVVSRRSSARRDRTGRAAVRLVAELIAKLVADTDCPVLGVGVGSPGVVFADGTVEESSNLHWHHVALAADLTTEVHIPVHVVNDANAAALGELQFGRSSSPNVLLVKIGLGVGAGLILDGHLIEGDDSAAGEIGHVVVDTTGDLCACGNRGCLETVVAAPALRARIEGRDRQASARILAQAGERLGMALAPVMSMLNLREVLLSGPPDLLGEAFRQATTAAIKQRTFPLVGSQLEVRLGSTGRDDVLLGTAAVVLKHELVVRR
ncbi:MAG TPA: ROK family transcriptional regulator [Acidimicrobiales bacterium]